MRILITGGTGFVGRYLIEALEQEEVHDLWAFRRPQSGASRLQPGSAGVRWVDVDWKDATAVRKAVAMVKPEGVFHLAAQSVVSASWSRASETLSDNVICQLNILEAVRELKSECRVHVACSSEQYGLIEPKDLPIKETQPFRPLSPYAVSKIGQDMLAYQYHQSYRIPIVRTRAFNHTGPGRSEAYAVSAFAKQLALIEAGRQEPVIHVGNLEAVRDFTDVRDVTRAYILALKKGKPGEVYNICSGKGWSIRSILDTLVSFSSAKINIAQDPDRMRPSDIPVMIGDSSKFRKETGWEPKIPFEQTLQDSLNEWREKLSLPAGISPSSALPVRPY